MRPEGDYGEQAEQNRCSSNDCFIGPLALGFDAEMSSNFLEGDFDLPTANEPSEDVARIGVEVSCQEGLRLELAGWVTHQEPADRHGRHAAAIPQRGAGGDLDDAVGSAVPETDPVSLPGDVAILEDGEELFVALALDRRPAPTFALLRREVEQTGIEAQAGDDADMVADGS